MSANATEKVGPEENYLGTHNNEDLLKYRPNPDKLVSKTDVAFEVSQKCCSIQNTDRRFL